MCRFGSVVNMMCEIVLDLYFFKIFAKKGHFLGYFGLYQPLERCTGHSKDISRWDLI